MKEQTPIPIAVVGIGCRFSGGANDPEKLWSLLAEGRDAWSEVPADRFNSEAFYHPDADANGALNCRGGHFLDQDIRAFDAEFFGISPVEAQVIDPQQRIQLETAYEALENAGIPLEQVRGSATAVFIAVFSRDYDRIQYSDQNDFPQYTMLGVGDAITSNRISYVFDLKGPSMTLDTGCSGSLVALHQACQSLRTGESSMALVGGTNLILSPDAMIPMSLLRILNPEGKCYPFDDRGSGYGRGEGVATVVLKRLDDAIRSGDPIRAVIRHTGINQDGHTQGITLPSQQAQQDLIESVYQAAGLSPRDIGYLEAHGTGTVAGDLAEVRAIDKVFRASQSRLSPLYLGSIKANIGHCESSSGIAGLIKTILVLEKGLIPPNVKLKTLKKELTLNPETIQIPTELVRWPEADHYIHLAAVNSFGYGGTNGHAVLEAAPQGTSPSLRNGAAAAGASLPQVNGTQPQTTYLNEQRLTNGYYSEHSVVQDHKLASQEPNGTDNAHLKTSKALPTKHQIETPRLLVLSAHSETSLKQLVKNTVTWAASQSDRRKSIADLAYTLSCRRSIMRSRLSIVASSLDELVTKLENQHPNIVRSIKHVQITFVFTGQGSQWPTMGRELMRTSSEFKQSLQESDLHLQTLGAKWNLLEELLKDKNDSRINESQLAQPGTTALQIAFVDLLQTLGVRPSSVIGHSSGEIAAAYAAGILSHYEALKVAYYRGFVSELSARALASKGAMLAVGLGETEVLPYLLQIQNGKIAIACINSPSSVTISGDVAGIEELKSRLDAESVFNRRLMVDTAYHSHHMRAISDEYETHLRGLVWKDPDSTTQFWSTVTGLEKRHDFGSSYWTDNLVSTVRFSQALEKICGQSESGNVGSVNAFLEIGPHSALSGAVRQTIAGLKLGNFNFFYASALIRSQDAVRNLLELGGLLFNHEYNIDLNQLNSLDNLVQKRKVVQDLLPYPWNHATKFWHESHVSKQRRLRAHPSHDLLGTRLPGTSSYEPVWRNIVELNSLPWLRDHVVDGLVVLPGAFYICSAVEALRQLNTDRGSTIPVGRFLLKDITFSKALVIPSPPSKVEIQLSLRSSQIATDSGHAGWEVFQTYCKASDDVWQSHCHGFIKAEYFTSPDEVELNREHQLTMKRQEDNFSQMKAQCTRSVEIEEMYQNFRENGNDYGLSFSILEELHSSATEAVGTVQVPNIVECMPSNFMQPHVIHPATFDSLFHINLPLFHENCSEGPIVPVSIKELAISTEMDTMHGRKLVLGTKLEPEGPRSARASVSAFQTGKEPGVRPVITMVDCELRGLGETSKTVMACEAKKNMVYRIVSGIDVNSLDANDIKEIWSETDANCSVMNPEQRYDALNQAASYYIKTCIESHVSQHLVIPEKHHEYLLAWMNRYSQSSKYSESLDRSRELDRNSFIRNLVAVGAQGEMVTRMGENLYLMLTGKVDPLTLMREDDLLDRFYKEHSSFQCCMQLAAFMKSLLLKTPFIKVLEIGAGTGGTTLPLLQELSRNSVVQLECYDFTDVSSGFFESAKEMLGNWSHIVQFKKLDIEQDPIAQGFEAQSYDLVIGSNVLHATNPLNTVMGNVHKLLKPRGRLAMIEVTSMPPYINIIFGLLPGWWKRFNEGQIDGPLLSPQKWNSTLQQNSFTGTDIVTKDYETSAHQCSLLISQIANQENRLPPVSIDLCCFRDGQLGRGLEAAIQKLGYNCQYSMGVSSAISEEKIYIIIDSGSNSVLEDPSHNEFTAITSLLTQGKKVLWVSATSRKPSYVTPESCLITGFARVARSENSTLELVTLRLHRGPNTGESDMIEVICEVLAKSFHDSSPPGELEYIWREGKLIIERLIVDASTEDAIFPLDAKSRPGKQSFSRRDRPLKLHVSSPGLLDSMVFVDDTAAGEEVAPDEIEVEAKAFGINFKDVFIALGQMKNQQMTGECAGIITRIGHALHSQYQIGDRVCGWRGTPYASFTRFKATNVHHIPDDMSFETAASIPVVYMTAYYGLVEVSRLSKGDKVLVHAASGGVGQAAIQIAQALEAEIFATVGSATKKQLLMDRYGIPESHIFSSRSKTFKSGIMRITEGNGVDVILNSLSGEYLQDTWDCIARFGTFIEMGKTDIYRNGQISMSPFDRNVNFSSIDLVLLADHRGTKMKALFSEVMSMFRDGRYKPVHPVTAMPVEEIEGAFRLIQGRKHVGKLVLRVGEETFVKATQPKAEPLQLASNSTYIIAGGRGSLGKSIIRFMISRGAKHLVVLSRRGLDSREREVFEQEIAIGNSDVRTVACDVTNTENLQTVISDIKHSMPPIKGVIQAAMVLQDKLLQQMTVDDYKRALYPKMLGTRNLVNALSDITFDFFIMLSSASNILGFGGQANYAAGCAYQDALAVAQSKVDSNAHYISLDLPMIEETDIIALHPEVKQALLRIGSLPMRVQNVLNLLDYCMSGHTRETDCHQIVTGFSRESLSKPNALGIFKNPLFGSLPKTFDSKQAASKAEAQLNVADAIKAATDIHKARDIVVSSVSKKMSALISLSDEGIDTEVPINSLGLDSLIAIELKNWIVQNFHSPLQSSEILDSRNIKGLAETVLERSTLANIEKLKSRSLENEDEPTKQERNVEIQKLPTMPLPDLLDSLDRYVEAVERFCSANELRTLSIALDTFKGPNGPGQELHRRAQARINDPTLDDWLYDLYEVDTWTTRRVPLNPWGHFFSVYPDEGIKHTQARRAAIISDAALRFKRRLETSGIDQDYMNEQPLDMSLQQYFFNSYLEPGVGIDKIQRTTANDHLIVLRNGHIFKIEIVSSGSSTQYLESQFDAILNASIGSVPSFATLTADERDSWTEVRKELRKAHPSNSSLLQLIEASAFVVCLDDSLPQTSSDRANQFLLSSPSNRWSDKSLQFVVCSNGTSAVIAEHAMIDGDTLNQLHKAIVTAIKNSPSSERAHLQSTQTKPLPIPAEFHFTTTPSLEAHISRVHSLFYRDFMPYDYLHYTYRPVNKALVHAHKLAANRVVQIVVQLAGRLFFGLLYPCMEAVSMRPFHKGRLDFMLTTVTAVYEFCTAAAEALEHQDQHAKPDPQDFQPSSARSSPKTKAELRALLTAAVKSLTNLTTNTARGRGWRNHFLAMRQLVRYDQGEELPEFFRHPSFERIGPSRISTDSLPWNGLVTEAGFHRPGEWKVWVHYEVEDQYTKLAIKAPEGEVEKYYRVFEKAGEFVRELLEGV